MILLFRDKGFIFRDSRIGFRDKRDDIFTVAEVFILVPNEPSCVPENKTPVLEKHFIIPGINSHKN
jgi:hypothetical protein